MSALILYATHSLAAMLGFFLAAAFALNNRGQ